MYDSFVIIKYSPITHLSTFQRKNNIAIHDYVHDPEILLGACYTAWEDIPVHIESSPRNVRRTELGEFKG